MNRHTLSMLLLLTLPTLVTGCKSGATPPSGSHHTQETCNSEAVSNLVGKTATPELLEQAKHQSGANTARIIGPDDVVTLEYDSRRLNFNTGAGMTIERVSCG